MSLYAQKHRKQITQIDSATIKKLTTYHWPGNIRELRHAVERAVIMSDSDKLTPQDFVFAFPEEAVEMSGDNQVVLTDLNLEHVEKLVVQTALKKHQGNVSKAAEELGLNRASLYRRMEKYGV
jgi:transcriptional regulator with PAS, ATPase and Fis domain